MKVERFKSKSEFSIWSSFENFQSFIENATIIYEFPCWQIRVLQTVSQLSNSKGVLMLYPRYIDEMETEPIGAIFSIGPGAETHVTS